MQLRQFVPKVLPNGVRDEQKVQRVQTKILQASDITSVSTTLTNVDIAIVPKPFESKGKGIATNAAVGMYTIENFPEIYPYLDNISSIGKFWATTNGDNIVVAFAKGTTLAQAQTALAGKTLAYQLTIPKINMSKYLQ